MSATVTRRASGTAAARALMPIDLLFASRFSCGLTPGLADDIRAAGGGRAWLVDQLDPDSVADPDGDRIDSWFDYLGRTPQQFYARSKADVENISTVMTDLSRRTVARRLQSKRQVQEVMVDFWSNLLHVPITHRAAAFARADYDAVIRTYALTTFEQLLQHTIVHPAMGINLNNSVSTKKAPNENLGRELLELHTVGVDGGYTEDDVKASAKILTGYRVRFGRTLEIDYLPKCHYVGPVRVMGFHAKNDDPDGQAVTMGYLSYLANHPATARRIARRLCAKFVREDPPADLVATVARAYRSSGTAIVPTLLAMVDHPAFAASAGRKVNTPQEDWQAMVRALGITVRKPIANTSFVNAMYDEYARLGDAPYEWDPPSGYPEDNASWSGAGRMLNGFSAHQRMVSIASRWTEADIPDLVSLGATPPVSLQTLIDAYCQRFFGEPSIKPTRLAVAALLGWEMDHEVTSVDASLRWTLPSIVATLLDSPQHLYR